MHSILCFWLTSSAGEVVEEIQLPTPYLYSPTFGGRDHDTLFVPTGSIGAHFNAAAFGGTLPKPAGDLFMIRGIKDGKTVRHPQL